MTHGGDGEAVCLQSVRVYVWRSDMMAVWQWWWVLLVSAQCIWRQSDVTVNGSVMTTGRLCHSWLPVRPCLTADTVAEEFMRPPVRIRDKKSPGLCIWSKSYCFLCIQKAMNKICNSVMNCVTLSTQSSYCTLSGHIRQKINADMRDVRCISKHCVNSEAHKLLYATYICNANISMLIWA